MKKQEIEKILAALQAGNYEVEVEEPNAITRYMKYDGTPFLRLRQDDFYFESSCGRCSVRVRNSVFICDFKDGRWYLNNKVLENIQLIAALEQADGVIAGKFDNGFALCELYAQLNDLPKDIDFCMEDDGFPLKDINEIGAGEAGVPIQYCVEEEEKENWNELNCSIDDGDLFNLYKFLKRKGQLPEEDALYELHGATVKAEFPDLYDEIIEFIEDEEENEEKPNYKFSVFLSHDIFELGLYGEAMK